MPEPGEPSLGGSEADSQEAEDPDGSGLQRICAFSKPELTNTGNNDPPVAARVSPFRARAPPC